MTNIVEMVAGARFSNKGNEYIAMNVDVSDFTASSVAVGLVGFVNPLASGVEFALIPNVSATRLELAVFTGFLASDFNPNNPYAVGSAGAVDGLYIFCVRGNCNALVDGTADVAVGDSLEILKDTTNFVQAGTSGTQVYTVVAHAVSNAVVEAAAVSSEKINLIGGIKTPSAS